MSVSWQVEALCEMFYELHAAYHGKTATPKPSERDIDVMGQLLADNACSPHEAKHVLAFVFHHDPLGKWATDLDGRVQSFVNGFAQMRRAAFKHITRPGATVRSGGRTTTAPRPAATANHLQTPAQREESRLAALAAAGETEERPSDDNRNLHRQDPPLRGPAKARAAIQATTETDTP